MTLEAWNTALQFASAVLLGLTFIVGAGAIWTSYVLNQRQQKQIAVLAKQTEDERLARVKIEEKLAPRSLSLEQQRRIAERLRAFGNPTFEVITFPGDAEPASLANAITAALQAAGWRLNNPDRATLLGTATGVVVTLNRESPNMRLAAVALIEALNNEGIATGPEPAISGGVRVGVDLKVQVAKKP